MVVKISGKNTAGKLLIESESNFSIAITVK